MPVMVEPLASSRCASHSISRQVRAGALATLVMDAAMMLAGRLAPDLFATERLAPQVIGRWAAALFEGRLRHTDITREPPRRGELALGLLTHYGTGVALTALYVSARRTRRGGIAAAAGYGAATALLPLLVLYPSLGYGWLGLRSGEAPRLGAVMLLGHTAFGVGIWLGEAAVDRHQT
jgi:hypothetical protein